MMRVLFDRRLTAVPRALRFGLALVALMSFDGTITILAAETPSRGDCVYRGTSYSESATIYGDPCPGQACGAVAGPLLTCRGGQWFYSSGASACSAGAGLKASPLWTTMPDNIKQAQAAYYKSLGCPD